MPQLRQREPRRTAPVPIWIGEDPFNEAKLAPHSRVSCFVGCRSRDRTTAVGQNLGES